MNVEAEVSVTDPDWMISSYSDDPSAFDVKLGKSLDGSLIITGDEENVVDFIVNELDVDRGEAEDMITMHFEEGDDAMNENDAMENCEVCGGEFPSEEASVLPNGNIACSVCRQEHFSDRVPGRPNYSDVAEAVDDEPVIEGFSKFMDNILISEGRFRRPEPTYESPQRKRAARHQDRPLNRVRFK